MSVSLDMSGADHPPLNDPEKQIPPLIGKPHPKHLLPILFLTVVAISACIPPSASQSEIVATLNPAYARQDIRLLLIMLWAAVLFALLLDRLHRPRYLGLVCMLAWALVQLRALINRTTGEPTFWDDPDPSVQPSVLDTFVFAILHISVVSVCWGWMADLVRTNSHIHIFASVWSCASSIGHIWWAHRNEAVAVGRWSGFFVLSPLLVAALLLSVYSTSPPRSALHTHQRQGLVQRILRVRTNVWILLYALWTSAPRAMLHQDILGSSPPTLSYILAAAVGAITNGGIVGQWVANRLGTRWVPRLLAGQIVLVALPTIFLFHTQQITPFIVVIITGYLLGGIESNLIAILLLANAAQDRVFTTSVFAMTASVGACLSGIVFNLLIATNTPPDSSFGIFVWMAGCGILVLASNAVAADTQRRHRLCLN